jgi:hypothetical protein
MVPRYGLFTVANGPLDLPSKAIIGGLEYETSTCSLPTGLALNCTTPPTKAFAGTITTITANPFMVRSSFTCGAVGMTDGRLRQMVMNQLRAGEQATVERIFSEETFDQDPGLQGASVVTPDCATDDVVAVVSSLEAALYNVYGLPGVLHVPERAGAYLMQQTLLWHDGPIWRTAAGTAVSIGNYANKSPANVAAAAGHAWIYLTGQVTIWRSRDDDVFVPSMAESLNRTTNQVTAQAEREYVVAFDCASFAADAVLCT